MSDSTSSSAAAPAPVPTERFERVLAFASDEADGLGHGYVTCQHILYALSRETKGIAGAVLERLGASPDVLHDILEDSAALHDRTVDARIDLAEEVIDAISRAVVVAREWGHRRLDTEHLLHGVLSAPTSADEMLGSLGLEAGRVLKTLEQMRQAAPDAAIHEEAAHTHRFTLESAWLLSIATDLARRYGSERVTSFHLLLGLIMLEGPVQRLLVDTLGLSTEELSRHLRTVPDNSLIVGRIALGDQVQRILGYAIGEVWNRGHLAITPLHIAMGLARSEQDPALDTLAEMGVPRSLLAEELERIMPPSVAG